MNAAELAAACIRLGKALDWTPKLQPWYVIGLQNLVRASEWRRNEMWPITLGQNLAMAGVQVALRNAREMGLWLEPDRLTDDQTKSWIVRGVIS